jgi:O-antigen/teichoic acid export membrane protein
MRALTLTPPGFSFRSPTVLIYTDQAIVSGFSFLSSMLLARYLGLQGFGVYSIAWLGVMVASSINQPLIITPMQTLGNKKINAERSSYLQALIFKQLFFAAAMALLAFAAVIFMSYVLHDWKVESIRFAFPLAVFAFLLQDFFRRYYFIIDKPEKTILIDVIAYGGVLVSATLLHFYSTIDAQFVLLLTAVFFLYAALTALLALPGLVFNWNHVKGVVLEHWDFSKWLTATAVLQWFSGNLFIIAAGAILGPVAVGATRMAQNIVGITHVLFLAMENIIPARAAMHMREDGPAGMMRYLLKFTMQMGMITFGILSVLAVFSHQIIELCYGSEYVAYRNVLIGFSSLYVIVFLGYPLRYAIRTLERTRVIFLSFILSSIFSIATAYPIIRTFGIHGVVGGLMVTQLITLWVYLFCLRNEIFRLKKTEEPEK